MPKPRLLDLGGGALGLGFEHPQQLAHAAHEQALLVDLDPGAGGGRKDDVVAGLHRHLDPCLLPPVQSGANREHDPLLRRRVVASRRHHQARASHAVGIELLDHHSVEQRPELVPDGLERFVVGSCAHAAQDIRAARRTTGLWPARLELT